MSALLIPFPASCRVRTLDVQKRISRAFKRFTDADTAETPEQRWARAVTVTEAVQAMQAKRQRKGSA